MVTVNGNSPAYTRMGELHFIDWNKDPIVTLCYVQTQPIKGIDNFVLISNNTLDAIQTDINFHRWIANYLRVVIVTHCLTVCQIRRRLTYVCVEESDLLCYPHYAPQLGGRN